ncbi:MAG TPA: hypothetical protein V6C97_15690 [Oculatellaceae cyanobacterium]
MSDSSSGGCGARFKKAMPPEPWTTATSAEAFRPLVDLIDASTQSNLFRSIGQRYESNGDQTYDFLHDLREQKQTSGKTTLTNGVELEAHLTNGVPSLLIYDDKQEGLKETVTLNETSGVIQSDKVEFCGVSRFRQFSQFGETKRIYSFDGGNIERTAGNPVQFHTEPRKR